MQQKFVSWFSRLGKAWEEKNPQAIPPLFADRFQYFETPFEKPYTTKRQLLQLWEEVCYFSSKSELIFP